MPRFYRCRWNKKLLGVFGGLGQALKIDPNILRLLAIFLMIPTGIIIIPALYGLLFFLLPEGPLFFIQPSYRRLYKNPKKKIFFGVCAGIGDYLKVDPTIIRLVFFIAMIFTGFIPMILTYIAANYLIPNNPSASL
jgi:phage shock protein C